MSAALVSPVNLANVSARAERMAERAMRHAAIAAAAESDHDTPGTALDTPAHDPSAWDTPVPYSPVPEAHSDAESFDPDSEDWRAVLAPSLAVALTPVALHAMAAAVKSATAGADLPVLEVARLTLTDGAVSIIATDRYRVHRLTVPAEGAAHAEGFVTPAALADVVRTLAPARARKGTEGTLPSIRVTVDAEGQSITWEGPGAVIVTTWEEPFNYPPAERFLEPEGGREPVALWHVNPKFMGDAMAAAAVVAGRNAPVRVTADAPVGTPEAAMIRVSVGEDDSPTGRFDACLMSVRA